MRYSISLLCLLTVPAIGFGKNSAKAICDRLEQHLQSLKSLEIRYEATEAGSGDETISGRIIWVKPDRFLHDTPSWTMCQADGEQWRYLKDQNTLIREAAPPETDWLPQNVLFHASSDFRADSLAESDDGVRHVYLHSTGSNTSGEGVLEFPIDAIHPSALELHDPEGTDIRYRIVQWNENTEEDAKLFIPPRVPPENLIDFRPTGREE